MEFVPKRIFASVLLLDVSYSGFVQKKDARVDVNWIIFASYREGYVLSDPGGIYGVRVLFKCKTELAVYVRRTPLRPKCTRCELYVG